MHHFIVSRTETGEIKLPFFNLVVQDLTGGDSMEYAYEVVAQHLGHNQFTLGEEPVDVQS